MKHWIFRHFETLGLVGVLVLIAFTAVAIQLEFVGWEFLLTLWATGLSALFLVQKQKLEETRLFTRLFESFNSRYDELNEGLNEIRDQPETEELTDAQVALLYDYFNLCAEEYLFYSKGYIFAATWTAWRNGMRTFMEDHRIRALWEEERMSDSYYGFEMPTPET